MKQEDHPAHNMPDATQRYAGDVIPLRPDSPTVNDYAADRQKINERSMNDIATRGPSAVDPSNLRVFPGAPK
jgi:hypothetical protein